MFKLDAIPKLTGASRARAGQSARKHSGKALLRKVSWQPVRPLAFLQIQTQSWKKNADTPRLQGLQLCTKAAIQKVGTEQYR